MESDKVNIMTRQEKIVRTSIIGIVVNLILVAFKATIGILVNSIAITLKALPTIISRPMRQSTSGTPADR